MCFIFFFKQKTAYEMRISDWSSDVCSSDLCGFSFLMIAAGATRFALVLTLGPIALFPGILRTETVAHALDHFGVAFSLVLSLTIAIKAIVVAITTDRKSVV